MVVVDNIYFLMRHLESSIFKRWNKTSKKSGDWAGRYTLVPSNLTQISPRGGSATSSGPRLTRLLFLSTVEMSMYEMHLPSLFMLFIANEVMISVAMI